MHKFLEIIKTNDIAKAVLGKVRNLNENIPVHGYVTITKNKGREDEEIIQEDITNLLTNDGLDFFHAQDYTNTTAGTRASNAIGLSENATDPAFADTELVGEIVVNGLERVQASIISHSIGTNVTTLENTFTATAAFIVHKAALFNATTAPVSGIMTHASEFTSDVTLANGDTITVTWTLTLG